MYVIIYCWSNSILCMTSKKIYICLNSYCNIRLYILVIFHFASMLLFINKHNKLIVVLVIVCNFDRVLEKNKKMIFVVV